MGFMQIGQREEFVEEGEGMVKIGRWVVEEIGGEEREEGVRIDEEGAEDRETVFFVLGSAG